MPAWTLHVIFVIFVTLGQETSRHHEHHPPTSTLDFANSMSNKFSQTSRANPNHHHISKNKLTGGYRKRLSGSRAIRQNVKFFPDFLFVILVASAPRLKNSIAWTGGKSVSTSHISASVIHAIFALTNQPWPPQIRCQTNFPKHRAPTKITPTYQRTN